MGQPEPHDPLVRRMRQVLGALAVVGTGFAVVVGLSAWRFW